jgi:hypothetical protein
MNVIPDGTGTVRVGDLVRLPAPVTTFPPLR